MSLSFGSILTNIVCSCVLILLVSILIKEKKFIKIYGIKTVLVLSILTIIRSFFIMQFPMSINVKSEKVLPKVMNFLQTKSGFYGWEIYHLILLIWLSGFLFKLIRYILGEHRFRKVIKNIPSVKNKQILQYLQNIEAKYNDCGRFRVIQLSAFKSPTIIGLINPIIILPTISLSESEISFVLDHETSHFYNYDLWLKMVADFLFMIYWWNPLAYLLKKNTIMAFELCTDLNITTDMAENRKLQYLECILKFVRLANKPSQIYGLSFANNRDNNLEYRFSVILENQEHIHKKYGSLKVTIIFCILIVFSFSFVVEAYHISPEYEETTVEWRKDNTYFIETTSGYEVYIDNKYFSTISYIDNSFTDYSIYKRKV